MIKAFIFDMDGTLMDSDVLWVKAIHKYLIDNNCDITEEEAMDIAYGKSWRSIYEYINKRFPKLNIDSDSMDTAIYLLFAQLRDTADIKIPESVELFKTLAKDYPVTIVSGAGRRDIEECIEIINAENILSFYLGSEDYLNGKPAPDGFLLAAEKFGVQPSECLVFEDSTAGVNAAKAAGMYCVALVRKQSPVQNVSNADLILDDLSKFDIKTIERTHTNA